MLKVLAAFIAAHEAATTAEEREHGHTWRRALVLAQGQGPEIQQLRLTEWSIIERLALTLAAGEQAK